MTRDEALRTFVQRLIQLKGSGDEEALLAELTTRVDGATIAALPDEDLEGLISALEDPASTANFTDFTTGVPDAGIFRRELARFRDDFLKEGQNGED